MRARRTAGLFLCTTRPANSTTGARRQLAARREALPGQRVRVGVRAVHGGRLSHACLQPVVIQVFMLTARRRWACNAGYTLLATDYLLLVE